jgi:hypothetical protein
MDMAFSNGLMEGSIWEIFIRIKNMDMESISGQMEGFTKENGERESSMDREFIPTVKESPKLVNGTMVSYSNGLNEI